MLSAHRGCKALPVLEVRQGFVGVHAFFLRKIIMRVGALEVVMLGIGVGVMYHRRHLHKRADAEVQRARMADYALWRRMPFA